MNARHALKEILAVTVPRQVILRKGIGGRIALTFDDGPNVRHTPAVLELLAAHSAKATFCLTGRNVVEHPDLAQRIVAAGHEVVNHGYAHLKASEVTFET